MNSLAVRYIIYKCAQDFMSINNMTVAQFNQDNNFSIEKCLQLPFFITIANGHKEKLLNDVFNNSFLPKIKNKTGVVVGNFVDNTFIEHDQDSLDLTFTDNMLQFNFSADEFKTREAWMGYVDKSIAFFKEFRDDKFTTFEKDRFVQIAMENYAFENTFLFYKNQVPENDILIKTFQFFVVNSRFFLTSIPEFGESFVWDDEVAA